MILENENFVSFLALSPVTKGHTLVVPRRHYRTLLDAPDHVVGDLFVLVQRIAKSILAALDVPACTIGVNVGLEAGQEINHLHAHIMPRFHGDGIINWPTKSYKPGEMERYTHSIKSALLIGTKETMRGNGTTTPQPLRTSSHSSKSRG